MFDVSSLPLSHFVRSYKMVCPNDVHKQLNINVKSNGWHQKHHELRSVISQNSMYTLAITIAIFENGYHSRKLKFTFSDSVSTLQSTVIVRLVLRTINFKKIFSFKFV